MNLEFKFLNAKTQAFFNDSSRIACISGGFGSGKSYVCCQKVVFLAAMFDNYRWVIARQKYTDLRRTTLPTFLKVCPPQLLDNVNEREGYITLKNGSRILLMHLDELSEGSLRGLEINSIYIDQPEEVEEQIFTTLNARVGRWDKAVPSKGIQGMKFNKDGLGNYKIPSYLLLSPNPDTESHWIYRYFHPDSFERREGYAYHEISAVDNPHYNPETLSEMLRRDESWVNRFVHGKWGISEAQIHRVLPASILMNVRSSFINELKTKWRLYRAMDHGESAPTSCLWVANRGPVHIFFQEYYQPNRPISYHRERIAEISGQDNYAANIADPAIFKKSAQKNGGFWCVADEWLDPNITGRPIAWIPGDNNELATRNRINELLLPSPGIEHPLTGEKNSPAVYFVLRSDQNPFGLQVLHQQVKAQRRVKLSEINGRPIYSDEREESDFTEDHAYDAFRYYIASHAKNNPREIRVVSPNSFQAARNRVKALAKYRTTGAIA